LDLLATVVKVVDIDIPPVFPPIENTSSPPHHIVSILDAAHPAIQQMVNCGISSEMVEMLAKFYKHSLLSTRTHFYPALQATLGLMLDCYAVLPSAPLLQVISVAISIFGNWIVFRGDFGRALQTIMLFTGPSCSPEVVKEFYALCQQYLKYCPSVSAPFVERITFAAMQTFTTVQERQAARAALGILETIIGLAEAPLDVPSPLVVAANSILASHGQNLTRLLFQALGGGLSRTLVRAIADVLFSFITRHPSLFRQWASQLLAQQDFPTPHLTSVEKQQYLTTMMRTRAKTQFKATVNDFAIQARALREYGAATITM